MTIINNGLTGLLAAQRALQVTGNNVANAMTDGYVRQRVEFAENPSQTISGGLNVGTGVKVAGINRVYDQFVADGLRSATTSQQRAQHLNDLAGRLDGLLGSPDQGIGQSLQAFFNQAEALNRDPTSMVNRQQLLTQGQALSQRFAQLDSQLGQLGNEVNGRLRENVNDINSIARSLAQVNDRIAAATTNVPNDLLDDQERLLTQLSGLIDFTSVRQPNGAVNVLVGKGQPLVLGVDAYELGVTQNEFDGTQLEISYRGQAISSQISGGAVAGLLAFRSEALDPARRELGQLALGLTEVFNGQHRLGVDLNGELGGDFFATVTPTVADSANNTGSASVDLAVDDPAALTAREYVLRYNGSGWDLTVAGTGAPVSLSGSGTAADPFMADGLAVTVSGSAAAGDRFLLSAVGRAANQVQVSLTDPVRIAAAAPVTTAASLDNLSSATISGAQVANIGDPALLQKVSIAFDDPGTYRILDAGGSDLTGPLAYASGGDISFNGWTVQVSGQPQAGDQFSVQATGPGSGDNSNALALAEISAKGFFGAGQLSLANLGANLVANVGATAARAGQDLSVQSALQEQAQLDLESVAGVNLDEEAANLLRYQEAYQAAARIIQVANDLFNTLLGAVGR